MDRCPLDGLEVEDLNDHTRRAHDLSPDQVSDVVDEGLKALATKLEANAREQGGWSWDKAAGNLSVPAAEGDIWQGYL